MCQGVAPWTEPSRIYSLDESPSDDIIIVLVFQASMIRWRKIVAERITAGVTSCRKSTGVAPRSSPMATAMTWPPTLDTARTALALSAHREVRLFFVYFHN